MYYPYLRGKQFELVLLREKAEFLASNNICPILEPVKKDFNSLIRACKELEDKGVPHILIINPKAIIQNIIFS